MNQNTVAVSRAKGITRTAKEGNRGNRFAVSRLRPFCLRLGPISWWNQRCECSVSSWLKGLPSLSIPPKVPLLQPPGPQQLYRGVRIALCPPSPIGRSCPPIIGQVAWWAYVVGAWWAYVGAWWAYVGGLVALPRSVQSDVEREHLSCSFIGAPCLDQPAR